MELSYKQERFPIGKTVATFCQAPKPSSSSNVMKIHPSASTASVSFFQGVSENTGNDSYNHVVNLNAFDDPSVDARATSYILSVRASFQACKG